MKYVFYWKVYEVLVLQEQIDPEQSQVRIWNTLNIPARSAHLINKTKKKKKKKKKTTKKSA